MQIYQCLKYKDAVPMKVRKQVWTLVLNFCNYTNCQCSPCIFILRKVKIHKNHSGLYSFSISDFTFRVRSLQLNRRTSIPWERKQRKGMKQNVSKWELPVMRRSTWWLLGKNKRKMRRNNSPNLGFVMLSKPKDIAEIHLWLEKMN